MEAVRNSPLQRVFPVLLFFAGLIALYYLYQYLFGPNTGNSYVLLDKTQKANKTINLSPTIVLPKVYEGGEFSFSTWIYINNWSVNNNKTKEILRMGPTDTSVSTTGFDTLRMYLGKDKPKLYVRFTTSAAPASQGSTDSCTYLVAGNESVEAFSNLTEGFTDGKGCSTCDVPEVELQRWVNITVAVNGRIADVYLNGKLARSCVLDNMYKVTDTYKITLADKGGFGGDISTTVMYDTALNPEQVYRNYMSGPEPITSLKQWLLSFFAPGVDIAITTK